MDYIQIMLDNLVKVYKIKYRILVNEEKGYCDDSPFLHVYSIDDKAYIFDLSEANTDITALEDIITYTLSVSRDIMNLHKNNSNMYINNHDSLTGTFNRAYFEKRIQDITNAVIIVSDVNNLKIMNDVFSHSTGDKLLITASGLLKKYAKPEYIISRCGGDEFFVIIPEGTLEEAKEYCKNIQNECKNYQGELLLKPQIAFGYAKQGVDEKIEDTIKLADDYMYKNKTRLKEQNDVIAELEEKLYELKYSDRNSILDKIKTAFSFGLYLDLPLATLSDLTLAIKIAEIGLLVIPKDIIFKTENLTEHEKKIIKKHPEVGFRLAKLNNSTLRIATTIYQCYECYDGTGYPCGIKGEQIDYLARIIALVTGYCELYRLHENAGEDVAYEQAIKNLESLDIYDPILKRQFIEYMNNSREIIKKGTGEIVL